VAAARAQPEEKATGVRRLFMSLAAISFVLQSLVVIGAVSGRSTSLEIGATLSSVACVAQKANHRSPGPGRDEEPPCCLLFSARACDAPQAAFEFLCASVAQLPEFRAEGRRPGHAVDKRSGRPTGWASSWSPRAPPLFS